MLEMLPDELLDIIYRKIHKMYMKDICCEIEDKAINILKKDILDGKIKGIDYQMIKIYEDMRRDVHFDIVKRSRAFRYCYIKIAEKCAQYGDIYFNMDTCRIGRIVGYTDDKPLDTPKEFDIILSNMQVSYRLCEEGRIYDKVLFMLPIRLIFRGCVNDIWSDESHID